MLSLVALATLPGVRAARASGAFRFRGAPLPECAGFTVTELGFNRFESGGPREASQLLITGEAGIMINISRHHALGVTYLYEHTDPFVHRGIKARFRRWLWDAHGRARSFTSVEASLGVIISGSRLYDTVYLPCSSDPPYYYDHDCDDSRAARYPSLVAGLDFNLGDLLKVAGQVEWVRLDQGESEWAVSVGIKAGSYLAFVAGAALGIGIASALSSW